MRLSVDNATGEIELRPSNGKDEKLLGKHGGEIRLVREVVIAEADRVKGAPETTFLFRSVPQRAQRKKVGRKEVRPHPNPLPAGEGERVDVADADTGDEPETNGG